MPLRRHREFQAILIRLSSEFSSTTQSHEARFKGRWQTFLGTSVIGVRQTDRFRMGFYVVVFIEGEGEMCGRDLSKGPGYESGGNSTFVAALRGPSEKSVRIMIASTNVDVTKAVVIVLLCYALMCVMCHPYLAAILVLPGEEKLDKWMKEANLQTRERWVSAFAKISRKKGAGDHNCSVVL